MCKNYSHFLNQHTCKHRDQFFLVLYLPSLIRTMSLKRDGSRSPYLFFTCGLFLLSSDFCFPTFSFILSIYLLACLSVLLFPRMWQCRAIKGSHLSSKIEKFAAYSASCLNRSLQLFTFHQPLMRQQNKYYILCRDILCQTGLID